MNVKLEDFHLSDADTRVRALDASQSFIVRAPAGSGKTTLLVSRFIHLLSIVDRPEEVLSMTFTRKATSEMRERILEILNPDSNQKLPTEEENCVVEKVRKRSVDLGWDLHNQPSRLQIMTIDGLASRLIRSMPWASRFGSVPRICNDADEVYRIAATSTLEMVDPEAVEFNDAIGILYDKTEGKTRILHRLIVETLSKRDQWMRFLLHRKFDEQEKLQMDKLWCRVIEKLIRETYDLFPTEARELLKIDESMLNALQPVISEWKHIADEMLTNAGTFRKRVNKEHFTTKAALDHCRDNEQLAQKLNELRDFCPQPSVTEDDWSALHAVSTVLQVAVAQLKLEFRKRGEVDFIEIAQQAEYALGTPEAPTDLALVLDYRFNHILVDEFQDTSISQRDLLLKLVSGWQRNDGRTLFLVGDPMQSIYRFREAEIGIFLSVIEHGLGDLKPIPLQLTRNFRSDSKLVNWFNAVFRDSFPKHADVSRGCVNYVESFSESDVKNLKFANVQIRFKDAFKNTVNPLLISRKYEARKVVADIKNYLARHPDDQIAVLIRNRSHASGILEALDEEKIGYYASEIIDLKSRPVVRDLLTLTRALLNLADRTCWLAILRAPWCGLTLDDLLVLAGDAKETILESNQ